MEKNSQRILGLVILLFLTMANYNRLSGNENIRAVQFMSIFAIGMLSGVLIKEVIEKIKSKNQG
jgi:hypothetical protein